MLERRSLEALIGISEHPVLGPCVRRLELCLYYFWFDVYEDETRRAGKQEHGGRRRRAGKARRPKNLAAYKEYLDDQAVLVEEGVGIAYLARAMSRLSNCKTIGLSDHHPPWGLARLENNTGIRVNKGFLHGRDCEAETLFTERVWRVLIASAAASRICVEGMEVHLGHRDYEDDDEYSGYAIRPDVLILLPLQQGIAQPSLSNLVYLSLLLGDPRGPEFTPEKWVLNLARLLATFPGLSHCRLEYNVYDYFLTSVHLCRMLRVPRLEILELSRAEFSAVGLINLFRQHRTTLKEVILCEVMLGSADEWLQLLRTAWEEDIQLRRLTLNECVLNQTRLNDYILKETHLREVDLKFKDGAPKIISITNHQELQEVIALMERIAVADARWDGSARFYYPE